MNTTKLTKLEKRAMRQFRRISKHPVNKSRRHGQQGRVALRQLQMAPKPKYDIEALALLLCKGAIVRRYWGPGVVPSYYFSERRLPGIFKNLKYYNGDRHPV